MAKLFDGVLVFKQIPYLLKYLPTTLYLTFIALVIGLSIGLLIAVIRINKVPVLNQLSIGFVSLMRGTPIIVQLYITYFGIPIALKYFNYYHGTNKGQIEAAKSMGMTGLQVLRRITLPQAITVALLPLGNSLIALIKGTSLAFTCSVVEITAAAKITAGKSYRYFEAYCSIAIIYWVITFVLERILVLIEKKTSIPAEPKEVKA